MGRPERRCFDHLLPAQVAQGTHESTNVIVRAIVLGWLMEAAPIQLESQATIQRLEDLVAAHAVVAIDFLASNPHLTEQIQSRLSAIGLLQATEVDGIFGPRTQAATEAFSRASFLDNATTGLLGPTFVKQLLDVRGLPLGIRQDVDLAASTVTTSEAFAKALQFTLPAEGGRVDDPFDPGGRTNKGIIQSVYNAYRRRKNLQPADVYDIADKEVKDIYFNNYWKPAQCASMVLPLAVVQFDTAVNFGVGGAVQFLQEALGLPADGAFGPQTLGAFQINNNKGLALKMIDGRIAYRHLRVAQAPSQERFLRGWLNRDNALKSFIQPLS